MPIYEYQCAKCEHRFERLQKFSDPPVTECPKCGGKVSQLLSPPAVQFKGSGWYVTDYARKSGTGGNKSKDASSGDGASKAEKSESKPAETAKTSKPSGSSSKE